jgi:FkbM family methyltransferase
LRANVAANGLGAVIRLDVLGIGLSDRTEAGFKIKRNPRNMGAARLKKGGEIAVHRGDALLPDARVDLVKIDVEGMEMQVLAGFDRIIAEQRPALFVEVDTSHEAAFEAWCEAWGYTRTFAFRHQEANTNVFVQPIGSER